MMTPSDSDIEVTTGDSAGTAKSVRERWPGGYIRGGVFVIERKIGGRKFHVSTHATTLRGAMKQLEVFEADPSGYDARGSKPRAALVLDEALIKTFHAYHLDTGVTKEWASDVYRLLVDWANHLRGADLRRIDLIKDLKPHLVGKKQKHHRVKAIRLLFKWLRRETGDITRAQDVTLDLPIPVVKPRQETGESKAVEFERLAAVVPFLEPHVRDVLELLAATGWHISEIRRFATRELGRFRLRDAADHPDVLATMGATHKDGGKWHFTALLFQSHVDAAQRIRQRGYVIQRGTLRFHLQRACRQAGVKPFNMGDMRASVLTWLRLAGVPPEMAMAYVGHTTTRTQEKFYVKAEATKTILPRTALRLVR